MRKYINDVKCLREGDHFKIGWDNKDREEVAIFCDSVPDTAENGRKICSSNSGEVRVEDLRRGCRSYFILTKPGFYDEVTAERLLPLKGVCNFRDLGGYVTEDGRRVKWNRFYRSGALSNMTPDDLSYVESLGLKKILDYRGEQEAEKVSDLKIGGAEYVHRSAMPLIDATNGDFSIKALFERADKYIASGNMGGLMEDGYRAMVFNNQAFREMVRIMQEDDERPFLQHCHSGKDRTGLGSAILLLILGVPMKTVKADYLASNQYITECNKQMAERYKELLNTTDRVKLFEVLTCVSEEYFNSAFDLIFKKYGSIERYFEEDFGLKSVDIEALRNKHLNP